MQRVVCMSVVGKTSGGSDAFYNGQRDKVVEAVRREMEAQMAQMEAQAAEERERLTAQLEVACDNADMQYAGRARLLSDRMDALKKSLTDRRGPVKRALRKLENGWAMVCGTIMCLPEICVTLGLLEDCEGE